MLTPGDTLDRYVVVRLIGSGGMGQVYEARDPRLQRSVALKVMRLDKNGEESGSNPAALSSRLLREARLAAALEHPNVVAVYDVGEIEQPEALAGTTYVAMELISGRSLRAYVGDASVPMKDRVRWLRDVALALAAAHARGMVHRDVKPENVMIREDGVVKVLDFGIAKRNVTGDEPPPSQPTPPTTAEGVTVGTPYYMAPEQMRGEPLDGRADQFAWGVMAYELLAGELPWSQGGDSLQLVSQVLSRDPPLVTAKNPETPTSIGAAVMRALAKSREHRFATMDALLAAMDADSGTRTLSAWTPGISYPPPGVHESPSVGAASTELAPVPRVESGTHVPAGLSSGISTGAGLPRRRGRALAVGAALAAVAATAVPLLFRGPSPETGASGPAPTAASHPIPASPAPETTSSVSVEAAPAVDASAPAAVRPVSARPSRPRPPASRPAESAPQAPSPPAATEDPYGHL